MRNSNDNSNYALCSRVKTVYVYLHLEIINDVISENSPLRGASFDALLTNAFFGHDSVAFGTEKKSHI